MPELKHHHPHPSHAPLPPFPHTPPPEVLVIGTEPVSPPPPAVDPSTFELMGEQRREEGGIVTPPISPSPLEPTRQSQPADHPSPPTPPSTVITSPNTPPPPHERGSGTGPDEPPDGYQAIRALIANVVKQQWPKATPEEQQGRADTAIDRLIDWDAGSAERGQPTSLERGTWEREEASPADVNVVASRPTPIKAEAERDLRQKIDEAFARRPQLQIVPESKEALAPNATEVTTVDSIRRAEARSILLAQPDDMPITFPDTPLLPNQVAVNTPGEYKVLLEAACQRIGLTPEQAQALAEEFYEHEMEHAAPAAREEGLSIRYGVTFFTDSEGGAGVKSFIQPIGETTIGMYRQMAAGPSDLSDSDRVALGHEHDQSRPDAMREGGDAEQPQRPAERLGFTPSPNPEIDAVSRVFGYTLPEAPDLVVLTEEDKQVLRELQAKGAYLGQWRDPDHIHAMYEHRYNTVFASEAANTGEGATLARAHETAHAFVHHANPELAEATDRVLASHTIHEGQPQTMEVEPDLVERGLVAKVIDEGVATWVSFEAVPELLPEKNTLLSGTHDSSAPDEHTLERHFSNLRLRAYLENEMFREPDPDTRTAIARKINQIDSRAQYRAGLYFINGAMGHLVESGTPADQLPQALVRLIQNPPRTIEELRDPAGFIDRLTAA